jgi:hypothetical protein
MANEQKPLDKKESQESKRGQEVRFVAQQTTADSANKKMIREESKGVPDAS